MHRPTVLHVAHAWVRPSEGFVADLVRSTTATRAVVATGEVVADSPASDVDVPVRTVPRPPSRWSEGWQRRAVRAGLLAVAARERPALLHAHQGYWGVHAAVVARALRLPWVLSLHGNDLLVHAARDPYLLGLLRGADLVVVPSTFLADAAIEHGFDPARLAVVPSGLDLADLPHRVRRAPGEGLAHADGRTVVTFAGRFVAKKGLHDAVAALAALAHARPDVLPRFVGTGPLQGELEAALADRGLAAEVVDGAPPGALRAALAATDLLLTPSKRAADGDAETLGLVNLEAQAMGVPVVSTTHGGIPEAVAPHGAVLVPPGDVDAMTDALVALVDDPGRWAAMGAAGRDHVATRFELGARTADVEEQYLSLVAGRGPAPVRATPTPPRPTVSVVTVTHDRRPLVHRTLAALLAQTYPQDRLEVVLVDNGTTDGTSEDLPTPGSWTPLGDGGAQLLVLRNEDNRPVAAARNQAVQRARGELVLFTDDDCRPAPTWAEALVAGFREGVAIVQGRTVADPALPRPPLSRTQWTPAEYGAYETANIAYDRRAFTAAGGFDEAFARRVADVVGRRFARYPFGEDTELAWRVKEGAASRFAVHALVEHHVFDPDPRLLLRRAALAAGFPVLVARIPELRQRMLWRRLFLSRHRALFLLAASGLVAAAGSRRAAPLLAAAPYLAEVLAPHRSDGHRRARAAALGTVVLRDVVEEVALVHGSIRARSPVI